MKMSVRIFMMIICAVILLSCAVPASTEVAVLDRDILTHGFPVRKDGWITNDEYRDESIHILSEHKGRKPKSSNNNVICRWVTIEIANASQIRTAISNDDYNDPTCVPAQRMAQAVNAVVALNGDFFKYNYGTGYVYRQGVLYRDSLDGAWDSLIIDDRGDFHGVYTATSEEMADAIAALREEGREPVNVLTFGPILVENGAVVEQMTEDHYPQLATQRIALCQLDELKYAVVEIDSDQGNGTGMNLGELARFILEIYPDCKIAYNLDGGGSTHLVVNGKPIHKTPSSRAVSDIVYFASAQIPEE